MFSLGSESETKRVVGLLKKHVMLYVLGFGDFFLGRTASVMSQFTTQVIKMSEKMRYLHIYSYVFIRCISPV